MRPDVVASECCAARFPQNTRTGFEYCLQQRFDGIEFDVHLSADGQVVVHHDYHLNARVTRDASGDWLDATGPAINQLSLAELKRFDVGRYRAGSREAAEYPTYAPHDGERIPALRELLSAYVKARADSTLWIELKSSPYQRSISAPPRELASKVIEALIEYGVAHRAVLLAFEWDALRIARELSAAIRVDFLTLNPARIVALNRRLGPIDPYLLYGDFDPRRFGNDLPAAIAAAGGGWWGPHVVDIAASDVAHAQQLGLQVNVWGVESNDAAIAHALALKADAITISDPDLLAAMIRR